MKTLLIIAAERAEFAGVLRRVPPPVRLQWPVEYSAAVETGGRRLLLVANGAGPNLAAAAADVARENASLDAIVSFGFCGGLDPALVPGSVVAASVILAVDCSERYEVKIPDNSRQFCTGAVVSVDRIVATAEAKAALRDRGAVAVEMEAAGLAARASSWQLPLYCIRSVTDTAGESFHLDLNAARDATGRINRWRLVGDALRRPASGVSELFLLRRRSHLAAGKLGEFFADCEF